MTYKVTNCLGSKDKEALKLSDQTIDLWKEIIESLESIAQMVDLLEEIIRTQFSLSESRGDLLRLFEMSKELKHRLRDNGKPRLGKDVRAWIRLLFDLVVDLVLKITSSDFYSNYKQLGEFVSYKREVG
jgi:hypothetical protein